MRIEEMTAPECRALLARSHIARLACARDNQPYVLPIHVAFDGISLYGYSAMGQKIEWMRQNPLVCIEVDAVVTNSHWESVVAFGTYEELPPTPQCEVSRREAERLFQTHPMWWEPGTVPLVGGEPRPIVIFCIHLHGLTGRRAVPDGPEREHFIRDDSDVPVRGKLVTALRTVVGKG
jgi:nitroimidazol reductase NimA-like FMN-containing flavoprotein (pyridoxamine 5'-phosphate oxidase superfamily)